MKGYDLVTPDGTIQKIDGTQAHVRIEGISPTFRGFAIEPELVSFNLKSTLAQLGIDGLVEELVFDGSVADIHLNLLGLGEMGKKMVSLLTPGMAIGKLFAADEKRRVRDPDYLLRMFGRSDQLGRPLLLLGGREGGEDLIFEVVEGRTVAYISLQNGRVEYDPAIMGFLPTVAQSLFTDISIRDQLHFHQKFVEGASRIVEPDHVLLVKTQPLHVRTVFGVVQNDLLPQGFHHTAANVLQPDTTHSGDVYELYGSSQKEIYDIPLSFYTLEPFREYVFFSDRDQLQASLEDKEKVFGVFETAPPPPGQAAVFVVKGSQLKTLKPEDWSHKESPMHEFPGLTQTTRQGMMVERYIQKQAIYPFTEAMEKGEITSQGVLFTRYLPSPVMKRILLSEMVHRLLKGIYFLEPSQHQGEFFSYEDRALLLDLAKFAIPVYWVDKRTGNILQYVQRPDKDAGMFVPLDKVNTFRRATFFGVYGSNLLTGEFENEVRELLEGLLELKEEIHHPLLNPDTPLAMVTGGGPGAMAVGNKVAKELGILSCANVVDFRALGANEQKQNPYVEARMTYGLDKLVERQAEFQLDFPIFLQGGIGTDFEYSLEEVRRKTGIGPTHPILLFGTPDYWRKKITSRFQCNLESGTIKGSEWVSNQFYCVQSGKQALEIYRKYFAGDLPIGPSGPIYKEGFAIG